MTLRNDIRQLQDQLGTMPHCPVCRDAHAAEIQHVVAGEVIRVEGTCCPACGSPDRLVIIIERVDAAHV